MTDLQTALVIVATGRVGERHTKKAWRDAAEALEHAYLDAARDGDQALIERLGNDNLDLIARLLKVEHNYDEALLTIARLQLERDTLRTACDGYVAELTQVVRRLKELDNEMGTS